MNSFFKLTSTYIITQPKSRFQIDDNIIYKHPHKTLLSDKTFLWRKERKRNWLEQKRKTIKKKQNHFNNLFEKTERL